MPIYCTILPIALKDRKPLKDQPQQPAWCFIWVSVLILVQFRCFWLGRAPQKHIKSGTNGPSGTAHTLASGTSNPKRHQAHEPHSNLRRASQADPHIPHTNLGTLSLYAFDHSAGTSQSFRKFCLKIHVTWQTKNE
jgi:hypothetical protein